MTGRQDDSWYFVRMASENGTADLDEGTSAHLVRVLRLREGAGLHVTDGVGNLYEAVLIEAHPRKARIEVGRLIRRDSPPSHHLAQSVLKGRETEEVLDLCAQLPLATFTPLLARHGQFSSGRDLDSLVARLKRKAESALAQSRQTWLCRILAPQRAENWLAQTEPGGVRLLCHPAPGRRTPVPASGQAEHLAIGPEGGWAKEELELADLHRVEHLDLGPSRLRATAAGFAALVRRMTAD